MPGLWVADVTDKQVWLLLFGVIFLVVVSNFLWFFVWHLPWWLA